MKIKRFFGILIILPILAGLFYGVAEAAECDSKTDCEETLGRWQPELDNLVAIHEAFLDCWNECGDCDCDSDGGDKYCMAWWYDCTTDKREKGEGCNTVYSDAETKANNYRDLSGQKDIEVLFDIGDELQEWRKFYGNEITALKIYLHSFKEVDVKNILKISNKDSEGKTTQEQAVFSDAKSFLGGVIDLLIKMVGVAAIVFLVIGGFRLVVAAGNDNEIQKAKSMIQYAVVGLAVALLAYIIVAAVQGILYR
ncbi:MAG: pilin [Patescibacteria group bacterium]